MSAQQPETEASSRGPGVGAAYRRGRAFFTSELWETSLETLPPRKARRYRLLRVAAIIVDGLLIGDTLPLQAAALTYYTVLSIVPLMAFVFAILKGFGAYDALVEEMLRPYLLTATSGNPALRRALEQVLEFVSQTGVTSLGFLGLIFVLYAGTRLLRNVEISLNATWGLPDGRSFIEQLRNYVTVLAVTPLCLLLAAGLATTAQLGDVLAFLRERLGLGGFIDWSVQLLGPLLVIMLGLFFLYLLMPNTRVRARSALLGAVVGGGLWYVFLLLHVNFQLGVARYNALYSSFAAIPIFLVWTYVSWLSVLIGAQTAATNQQGEARARQHRWRELDLASKEALALSTLLAVARPFVAGEPPRVSLQALSDQLGAPLSVLRSIAECLARAQLLVAPGEDAELPLVLSRSPEHVRVLDVLGAFRGSLSEPDALPFTPEARALDALLSLDETAARSAHNQTLAELLERH
jgi:membrane protein